jgi:hypothetical protein
VVVFGASSSQAFQALLSSDSAAVVVPASVQIPAGAVQAPFVITTSAAAPQTTAHISTTLMPVPSNISVNDPAVLGVAPTTTAAIQSFQLNSASVSGGQTFSGTVTLNQTTATPVALLLTSGNPSVVEFPFAVDFDFPINLNGHGTASVEVPAGSSQVTFSILAVVPNAATIVNLTASLFGPNGNSMMAIVTVTP